MMDLSFIPASSHIPAVLSDAIFENVARQVLARLRREESGIERGVGFRHTDALELALVNYVESGEADYLRAATNALENLVHSEFHDRVGGGFFSANSSEEQNSSEKHLDENARLLLVYLHAHQLTGLELFRDTAHSIVRLVRKHLYQEQDGYFFARVGPDGVDDTLYTDANAQMALALLEAARLLDEDSLRGMATSALAYLGEELYASGRGMYHARRDGEREPLLRLSDQLYVALGWLEAFQSTARRTYLTRAQILAELTLGTFFDEEQGAFVSEIREQSHVLERLGDRPIVENAAMADLLIRLAHLTGEDRYRTAAERTLAYFAADYADYTLDAARYALAVHNLLRAPLHIAIIGSETAPGARELLKTSLKQFGQSKMVELVDPSRDVERLKHLGYSTPRNGAQAYVCIGEMCFPPVSQPETIAEIIARARGSSTIRNR